MPSGLPARARKRRLKGSSRQQTGQSKSSCALAIFSASLADALTRMSSLYGHWPKAKCKRAWAAAARRTMMLRNKSKCAAIGGEPNGMPNKHAAMLGKLLRSMDALCTNAWRTGPCSDTKSSSNRPAASFAMILKTSSSIGWVATATTIACCAAS